MRGPSIAFLAAAGVCASCGGPERSGVEEVFNFTPLAYYEKSREPEGYSVDVLWPLVNWYRAGEARGSRFFPIYAEDRVDEATHNLNLLLFYWHGETAERSEHTLFPLFGRETSKSDPEWSQNWFLLFLGGANFSSEITSHWLAPLYWRKWSKTNPDFSQYRFLLALIGAVYDTDYANRWFFPFYFDKDSQTHNTWALWPFYGFSERHHDDEASTRLDHVLWPLFRFNSSSNAESGGSHLLSFHFLLGLFDHEYSTRPETEDSPKRQRDSTVAGWVLGKLFSIFETTRTDHWGGTRVVSLWNERVTEHFETSSPERDDSANFTSLFASSWKNDETGALEESHSHLFPLYSSTTSTTEGDDLWILTPLYRHQANLTENSSSHDLLLGLWSYGSKGEGETLERHWRALPLLWFTTRPDTKTHLVLPLYYHLADSENDYFHFIPFYGKNTEANGKATQTFILTPLYIGTRDERTDLTRTDLLFPLISWEKSVNGSNSRFVPFWNYTQRAGVTHWNSLFLVNRRYSEVESATLLYPLWADRTIRGEGRLRSLLPIVDFTRNLSSSSLPSGDEFTFLYPLSSFREEGDAYENWFFPFYWWRDDAAGHSAKHFWPFFGVSRDSDAVTRSVIAPLFSYGSNPDGTWSELHLLRPLFAKTHHQDLEHEENHLRFFPFFWWCDGVGPYNPWSTGWVLWPLWRYEQRELGDVHAHSLFKLGEYERSADGLAEQFQILHALYRYRRDGTHETRSIPFLFRYETEGDRATLHLFHFIPIEF